VHTSTHFINSNRFIKMEQIKNRESQLDRIEKAVILGFLVVKNVLTFDEAATYIGVSKSHLYKLTSAGDVPHYKPRGKMVYFDRLELENWLKENRIATNDEIEAKANTYVTLNGRVSKKTDLAFTKGSQNITSLKCPNLDNNSAHLDADKVLASSEYGTQKSRK